LGLLGAARIAPKAVIEPAPGLAQVVAVAARERTRAAEFAARHGIARVFDDYAALVESPDIDAVYVGLPASAHYEWTLRALAAGKHVLCEKPLCSNASEARVLVDAADKAGRVLMEAHHWRYHPLAERMGAIVRSGVLGRLERFDAVFDAPIHSPTDIRWKYELGGGALMDLGCYTVQWLRFVAGNEGRVVRAQADEHPRHVDRALSADIVFPGGLEARIACSMHPEGRFVARLVLEGDAGRLSVDNPLAPQNGHEIVLDTAAGESRERVVGSTTYRHQLEAFATAVSSGAQPLTGGRDAIETAALIDAIYLAAGLPLRRSPGAHDGA
jgi:predicted dehydrogenase